MALEAWYPLHKDFNDYSGHENHLTGTATMVPDGKIGSAPTGSTGCSLAVPFNENLKRVFSGAEFTITFWVRNNGAQDDWADLLQYTDTYGVVRRFERYNSTNPNNADYWCNIGKNETPYVGPLHQSADLGIPNGTWYHVALCHTPTESTMYINGVVQSVATPSDPSMSGITNDLKILRGSGNPDSELNDLRFYSHALSLHDVQKIAMCKMLHWNFIEQVDITPVPGRYKNNEFPLLQNWHLSSNGLTGVTASPLGYGDVYQMDWVAKFGRDFNSFPTGVEYPYPETLHPLCTYCFSVWFKLSDGEVNPPNGFEFGFGSFEADEYYEIDANGAILTTFSSKDLMQQSITTSWKRMCCIVTLPEYAVEAYVQFGYRLYGTSFEYCLPQLTETNVPVAYSAPNEMTILDTFYDCSGFGNHGTPNNSRGILQSEGGEAGVMDRGMINQTGGVRTYIQSNDTVYIPKEGTMMAWIQGNIYDQRSSENLYPFGFDAFAAVANYSTQSPRNGLYYHYDGSGSAVAVDSFASAELYDNEWHHYAVSWDSTTLTVKAWVDGVSVGTAVGTNPMYHVGTWRKALMGTRLISSAYGSHNGRFSDYRIYGTTLSNEQIEKIVFTKATITKKGKLSVYEVNASTHRGSDDGSSYMLSVRGSGWENGANDYRSTIMDGSQYASTGRGHVVVVFDNNFQYWGAAGADTYSGGSATDYYAYAPYTHSTPSTTFPAAGSSAAACDRLKDFIETVPDGYLVCITTRDSALMSSDAWYQQLVKYFGVTTNQADLNSTRINWLLVAEKRGKLYAEKFAARYDGYVETSLRLCHNKGINGRGVLDIRDISEVGVTDGLIGYWKLDQQTADYVSNLQNTNQANVVFDENALMVQPNTWIQTGITNFNAMANSTGFTLMAMIKRKYDVSDLAPSYSQGVIFGGRGYNWGILGGNSNSNISATLWVDSNLSGGVNSGDTAPSIAISTNNSTAWLFVSMSWDPTSRTLSLTVDDNTQSSVLSSTEDLVLFGDQLDLGSDGSSWYTRALIKEARCYNRPLDSTEVVLMRKYLTNETGMNISRDYTAYVNEVSEI